MIDIKVSIIVPVYNTEKYLKKCLNSLVKQTLDEIEIIIINDGSVDKSQEIIDEFSNQYPDKIKSYIQSNSGFFHYMLQKNLMHWSIRSHQLIFNKI